MTDKKAAEDWEREIVLLQVSDMAVMQAYANVVQHVHYHSRNLITQM